MRRLNLVYLFKAHYMNDPDIPVLLISFNRPELTKGAIENIRILKPSLMFFSVDGPRPNNSKDVEDVEATKDLVRQIDWDCEVITSFGEKNYGSGEWPYRSITWALTQCENLLILEDDVRISPDFYVAAQELIPLYKDNEKIFAICASNISKNGKQGYYFTKYFSGWGWITWSNKWKRYSYNLLEDKKFLFFEVLKQNNFNILITLYFYLNFFLIKINRLQAWDYQVNYMIFKYRMYNIKFFQNLSINVGIGKDATHTKILPEMQIEHFNFQNIEHPKDFEIDAALEHDWRKARIRFILTSWLKRLKLI